MSLNDFVNTEEEVKAALIGTIFADGSIEKQRTPNGRGSCEITHTNKNLDYLQLKKELFEMLPQCKCKIKPHNKSTKEKTYMLFRLTTNRTNWLTEVRDNLYKITEDGKRIKLFKKEYINKLSDFGLLLMYLDDGCLKVRYNKNGDPSSFRITFCLESFTLMELNYFRDWLLKKYNVETRIYRHYKKENPELGYRIWLNSKESLKLMKYFDKFYELIPSMKYKYPKFYLS